MNYPLKWNGYTISEAKDDKFLVQDPNGTKTFYDENDARQYFILKSQFLTGIRVSTMGGDLIAYPSNNTNTPALIISLAEAWQDPHDGLEIAIVEENTSGIRTLIYGKKPQDTPTDIIHIK